MTSMRPRAQAEQAEQEGDLPGGSPRWAPGRVRALVGVSGVYNVAGLADHFHERGLYRPLLERIMSFEGRPELKLFSPAHCVKARPGAARCEHGAAPAFRNYARRLCVRYARPGGVGRRAAAAASARGAQAGRGAERARARAQGVEWGGRLPRVVLLHGTADRCALVGNARQFAEALRDAGAQARPAPPARPVPGAVAAAAGLLAGLCGRPGRPPAHRAWAGAVAASAARGQAGELRASQSTAGGMKHAQAAVLLRMCVQRRCRGAAGASAGGAGRARDGLP